MLTSVAEVNGKYYCTGYCWDSINYIGNNQAWGIEGVKFAVFDAYGNKLIDTIYQKSDKNIAAANGKLLPQLDGSFLLAADETDTNGKWYLNIMRFDTTGKVIWEKQFPKPVCTNVLSNDFWRLVDFLPDSFGNWLMLSTIVCETSGNGIQHDMFLMKLDSSFNLIWQKQYGYLNMNDIAGKLLIEHDGYILAGGRSNSNLVQKNFIFNAEMYKVDTSSGHLWHWLSDSQKKVGTMKDVIRTQDGGYLYCGMGDGYEVLSGNQNYSVPEFRGWVEKLDSNRNVVWSRAFNDLFDRSTEFKRVIEAPDGRIHLFGNKFARDSLGNDVWNLHQRGWFMTLSADGDSLRERTYYNINTCADRNWFHDAEATDDGGFMMVGEAVDECFGAVAPIQRGWLVKVDSNGCLGPGDPQCWPTDVPHTPVNEMVSVYPNPVRDSWYISNKESKKLEIIITDITGRTILEKQSSSVLIQYDLGHYPPGMYLYRITSNGGILLQGKLLKQ